jgi:hypothetical protein
MRTHRRARDAAVQVCDTAPARPQRGAGALRLRQCRGDTSDPRVYVVSHTQMEGAGGDGARPISMNRDNTRRSMVVKVIMDAGKRGHLKHVDIEVRVLPDPSSAQSRPSVMCGVAADWCGAAWRVCWASRV